MSCAELMYHHQNLTTGFPYHSQRSAISDVYYGGCNSDTSAACSDYNAQVESSGQGRVVQPSGRPSSSSSSPPSSLLAAAAASSTEFSAASSSSSLSLSGLLPSSGSSPHHHQLHPQQHHHHHQQQLSADGADSRLGAAGQHALPLLGSPCGSQPALPPPTMGGLHVPAVLASSTSSTASSSLSSATSPSSLAQPSSSTLSPSYFPAPPPLPLPPAPPQSSSSSSSSVSAFSSHPPTQGSEIAFPATPIPCTPPHPAPSLFLPPPLPSSSSSSSSASPYGSSLKRGSSTDVEQLDDFLPKKRYVASNCVLLTYHSNDTSSEVDDHFSKALSRSSAGSSCGYGPGSSARHSSAESPPMSQRNFPPSFWDADHYLRQQTYNYQALHGSCGSGQTGYHLGTPHDPLYPLSSPFLSGSLGMPAFHPSFSSLHKDPWGSFPFSAGHAKSNFYSYPRTTGYPDHSTLSANYGSMATGTNSGRFSSSYSSFLFPKSSVRSGRFPSSTITSAQCSSGELGSRMTSFTGDHTRNSFGSGSIPGQF